MSLLSNSNAIPSTGEAYNITDSLRFRKDSTAYLNWTPASAGNQKTWTWSGWVKRGDLTGNQALFTSDVSTSGSGTYATIRFVSGQLEYQNYNNGTHIHYSYSTAKYRDPSAWYHIVVAVDTTQATGSNRVKMYVNGEQITKTDYATFSQNTNGYINNNNIHYLGTAQIGTSNQYFDGYMTEVHFVDGQALTPSDFGETNSNGVWQPIEYTGTYGTNGFYMPMNTTKETYDVDFVVVAGGGSGGSERGGGGGAGGYRSSYNSESSGGGGSAESKLALAKGSTYTITVGAGATAVYRTSVSGNSSSISYVGTDTFTSIYGGAGGTNNTNNGSTGGSGGGGAGYYGGTGGSGTANQGYAGGDGQSGGSWNGGGGGGAGSAGQDYGTNGGDGGNGVASTITGSSVTRGGGGGGGSYYASAGSGGTGGGGNGATGSGTGSNGTVNTGGGGGGSGDSATGGNGGSGIVILRMPTANYTGTTTGSPTVTTSGSDTILQFTSSGSYTA